MSEKITVTSPTTLSNSFVGDTVQVCVVTRDLRRTIEGFVKLGIGPWAIYTFSPENVSEQTYMGRPEKYSMRLALTTSGNMWWEVIEPLEGPSIYKDFLAKHGEGVQHVGMGCLDKPWKEKLAEFEARGCKLVQSGTWKNDVKYAYFGTEDLVGTTIEIFDIPAGYVFPEPEEWYPGKPA